MAGVNASTLRAWEREGIIAIERSPGGHRTFDDADIDRIRRIHRLRKVLGYGLPAIRQILQAEAGESAQPAESDAAGDRAEPVADRVRALRRRAGLSLRQLAEASGVGASHLSMFERGGAFPSPPKLAAVARALGVSLGDLLGATERAGRTVVRRGEGRMVHALGPGITVEQLSVGESLMDCEVWTLAPGAGSDGAYEHEGEELIFVVDGTFELSVDGGPVETLGEGDSAYFDSSRSHRWRNPGDGPATVLWVNTDKERLAALAPRRPAAADTRAQPGQGLPALHLPAGSETIRVMDTHTAGHPTRIVLEPFEHLTGDTVQQKRDDFRARFDHLRGRLLHEPRGHSATFGLVPVPSAVADFGAIFVSSYKYLDMCGHGTIGYARALAALGHLEGLQRFTLEVPAGTVTVELGAGDDPHAVALTNVPSFVAHTLSMAGFAQECRVTVAYGGCWYASVDAKVLGIPLLPDKVSALMEAGADIKEAVNAHLAAEMPDLPAVDSVLFHESDGERHRQIVILERNKFDRSPCGTGMSARMAELAFQGRLATREPIAIENVLGVPFRGEIVGTTEAGGRVAIVPRVVGHAHITGVSTLVTEADDPLAGGFLCR
jgi:proline racemase/DNA-binding transcriptional MerR regulator/quercetin dioxygenase-like cupin family protein